MLRQEFKFTRKCFLVIVTSIILVAFSVAVFLANLNSKVDAKVKEVLLNEVASHQKNLESKIEVQFQELEGISRHLSNLDTRDIEMIIKVTSSFISDEGFNRIVVAFDDGIGYLNDGSSYNISERLYFQEIFKGSTRCSEPVDSIIDGQHRLALSVPIYNGNEVVGMLMGSYNMALLSEVEFSELYDNQGYTYIIDSTGNLVLNDQRMGNYKNNIYEHFRENHILNEEQLIKLNEDITERTSNCILVDGIKTKRYLVYVPLNFNDWIICYSVPVDNAFQDYQFIIQYETYFIITVAVILLVTVFYILIINRKERLILLKKADYDSLTGLYNRSKITDLIKMHIISDNPFGLAILDIDDFKKINDTYGHPVGDAILKSIGIILKKELKEDIVGRLGGDEFVIIIKDVTTINLVIQRLERACNEIALIKLSDHPKIKVTCSCGLAVAPKDGETAEALYKAADSALYIAKSIGKNKLAKY